VLICSISRVATPNKKEIDEKLMSKLTKIFVYKNLPPQGGKT